VICPLRISAGFSIILKEVSAAGEFREELPGVDVLLVPTKQRSRPIAFLRRAGPGPRVSGRHPDLFLPA